jgi:trk system potassium uptake protein TrkA
MKGKRSSELYGIIGLGRFGFALAKSLADSGRDVLVVDSDEQKIRKATAFTDNAYVVGTLTKENLEEIGVQNCDTAVVCIGERIDTSILTTLTVLQLGVRRVISKATSAEQGSILEMMGAEVVYPERDMALRVAKKLIAPHVLEYISLSDDTDISEIELTAKEGGRTIEQLNLRKRFGLNIIAVRHADKLETEIDPKRQLQKGDLLVVIGKCTNINKFEQYLGS